MKPQHFFACLVAVVLGAATAVASPADEGSFQRNLKVSGPVDLHVSTGSGTIKVTKGSGGEVRISARIKASSGWSFWSADATDVIRDIEKNPPVHQEGNRIVIETEGRRFERISVSYDIQTPADSRVNASSGSGGVDVWDVAGPAELVTGSGNINAERIGNEVRAHTGSGGIDVRGANGSVRVNTGSGHIAASDVKGDVEASTGSGNITVIGATGKVRAHAASGRVKVEKAVADLDVHSSSGGLEVDGTPKSAHWDLETASGTVKVSLPHGTAFELDAHAGSGSVSTSHPVSVSGTMHHGELRGVAGSADNHLRIRTSSGSIRID